MCWKNLRTFERFSKSISDMFELATNRNKAEQKAANWC